MKLKKGLLFSAALCAVLLSACDDKASEKEDFNSSERIEVEQSETEQNETEQNKIEQSETEQNKIEQSETEQNNDTQSNENVNWVSPLGYSITYNSKLFSLNSEEGGSDVYTYVASEELKAPIYVSAYAYDDMDAQTVAEGLALQSGLDDTKVDQSYFGADSIETRYVYYEKEEDGVRRVYGYNVIPRGDGALVVEFSSYVGDPRDATWAMEELLGSFSLVSE